MEFLAALKVDHDFMGKRALVTGAGQGIGRAIALELSRLGADVLAVSRTLDNLLLLINEDSRIKILPLDVSDWEKTKEELSDVDAFDFVVNNAGVAILEPVGSITEEAFDKVFGVNVKGALNIAQITSEKMKAKGIKGSIVNVSSQAAIVALNNHAVYCASKAALDQITKVMALELGPHQIRVNSVNPTVVNTEMGKIGWGDPDVAAAMKAKIPLRKFCEPEDVVNAVLFLLSDKAAMITGIQLPVDGGYTAC